MNETYLASAYDLPVDQIKLRIDYFLAFLVGFEDARFNRIQRNNDRQFLENITSTLSQSERKLIYIRFGFIDGSLHDISECAKKMYITKAEANENFNSAIAKLQKRLERI